MTMCIFRLACLLLQKAKCTDYESSKGIVSIFRGVRILPNFTGTGDVILQDRFHVLDKTLRTGLWTKHRTGNTGSLPVPFQPLDQITKINDYGLTTKNVKVNKIWAVYQSRGFISSIAQAISFYWIHYNSGSVKLVFLWLTWKTPPPQKKTTTQKHTQKNTHKNTLTHKQNKTTTTTTRTKTTQTQNTTTTTKYKNK